MAEPAIETQELVREFKKGPRAVDGINLRVEPGEVYGFLGPNGAGKSTTVHMLTTLLPPTAGRAWVAGHDVVENGSEVRATIGAALQDAALDPYLTGREHMKLQTALHGMRGPEARERSDVLLAAWGSRAGGGPPRGRLLRRHEAAARPGPRARAPPAHPVPRRAHHRPRPAEPHRPLGGGPAPGERPRRDGLPHHAVPRGGRRAGGPRGHHRPRSDRGRGHAGGAQGGDRPAERGGDPPGPGRARAHEGRALPLRRVGGRLAQGRLGAARRRRRPARRGGSGARLREHRDPGAPAARAHARRRLPREDGPLPRGRGRRRAGTRVRAAA